MVSSVSGTAIELRRNCRSLIIFNSTFTRSQGSSCISLTTESLENLPRGQISIIRNTFKNNSLENVIYVNEVTPSKIQLNDNTFENPTARYEVYQATPWKPGYLVDARRNWWGSSDPTLVKYRIYDFYIGFPSAIVDISSVYKESEMLNLIDSSSWRDWTFYGLTTGGKFKQNLSIDLDTLGPSAIDVTTSIYVPQNIELRLMGSKVFNFVGSTGILVEGTLVINGGQRNYNLRLLPKVQNIKWGGIWFVKSRGSYLTNVNLTGTSNEMRLLDSSLTIVNSSLEIANGVSCDGSETMTLFIDNSEISSSSSSSIRMNVNSDQVTLSIMNSRIKSRNVDGIIIFAPSSISFTLENSILAGSTDRTAVSISSQNTNSNLTTNILRSLVEGSISVRAGYTNFTAVDSTFISSTYFDLLSFSSYHSLPHNLNVTLLNNSFIYSGSRYYSYYILKIYNSYAPLASVRLQKNRFSGRMMYAALLGPTVLDISTNVFNNSSGESMYIQLRSPYDGTSSTENNAVQIKDNVFGNNSGDSVMSFECNSWYEYVASIQVAGNTFANNSVTSILTSDCRGLYVTENKFLTQRQTIAYRTSVPLKLDSVLYATGNFWNTSDFRDIAAMIYDRRKDQSLSPVEINPWYIDANMTVFGKTESAFLRNGGYEVGGTLTEDITLEKREQAYVVVEDIFIPSGITLQIEEGVQLNFVQGGIIVQGRLIAIGSKDNWISMKPDRGVKDWKGIIFQNKFSNDVYQHESHWWEVQLQSEWRAIEYQRDEEMKRLAEILCEQAGFSGAKDYGSYNCSQKTAQNDSNPMSVQSEKSPPCDNPSQRVQISCRKDADILQDCSIYKYGSAHNSLLRLDCLPKAVTNTRIINKIVSRTGYEVTLTSNDSPVLSKDTEKSSSNLFVVQRPCLAGSISDCVSFMSLKKPGWFIRHLGPTNLILEPRSNPTNSSTFLQDASFVVRQDQDTSGHVRFEALNLPSYFISIQGDSTRVLLLRNSGNVSNESASYRLIESPMSTRRRKRQTPVARSERKENSQLKFVRISSATVGITVKGFAPQLENIVVENSTGNGILQRGYASGNFTIANSRIAFNRGPGIRLTTDNYQIYSHQINIVGCEIVGNIGGGIESTSTSSISIANNTFEDNGEMDDSSTLVSLRYATSIEFFKNTVNRNQFRTMLYIRDVNALVTIQGNTFVNNSYVRRSVVDSSTIELYYVNGQTVTITGNHLDNPSARYELQINSYTENAYDQRPFNFSFNFWNIQHYSAIIQRISCFFNDMQKRPVNIWPAILKPDNNSLLTMPDDNSHFFENGTGGEIYTSLVISFRNQSYTIERGIYIEVGATIVIEAGVVLKFKYGRGIFVKGTLILKGTVKLPVTFASWSETRWGGLILMQPLLSNFTSGSANLSHLVIEGSPYTVSITAPTILVDSLSSDSTVKLDGRNITVQNSVFSPSSQDTGLWLTSSSWRNPIIRNAAILNSAFKSSNYYGINAEYQNLLYISNCNFTNNDIGIKIQEPAYNGDMIYTISNSQFQQNSRAVYVDLSLFLKYKFDFVNNTVVDNKIDLLDRVSGLQIRIGTASNILIQKNIFANLSHGGIYVDYYKYQQGISVFMLRENTFSNISATVLTMNNILYSKSTIQNNIFASNAYPNGPSAISIVLWYESVFDYMTGNISVIQNKFQNNFGQHIFKFVTPLYANDSNYPFSKLSSNLFLNNIGTSSLILSQYHRLNVNDNIFKNPQTNIEMKVGFSDRFQENCTNNWWGSANKEEIASRLYDKTDNRSLGVIVYEPFLNTPQFSCETVSGCSGHGLCIMPETCECSEGWQGPDCSQVSCSSIQNCYNRGRCIGPNSCECDHGWFGNDCSEAVCTEQKNCSGHGICAGPNQCLCFEQFSGTDCTQCVGERWGSSCLPCPRCVHGYCNKVNGKCVCNGANWAGDLCDTCSSKFFGAACLPIVRFTRIAPVTGPDVGNTSVRAIGDNFPNVATYRCRFGDVIVPGVWLSDENILCQSPAQSAGTVAFSLSVTTNEGFLATQFSYSYYPHCPPGACGSQMNPARGGCSMGTCICFVPWTGSECSALGLPPKIIRISSQTLIESEAFNLTAQLSQGTAPVQWQLVSGPSGMLINGVSGRLEWSKTIVKMEPYVVTIASRNDYGSDQVTFNLSVPPSYYAVLDSMPKRLFVPKESVVISGRIYWNINNTFISGQELPVNIIINNSKSRRTIATKTRFPTEQFYETFYLGQNDIGRFQADSRHPFDVGFSVQQYWSVYGLQIQVTSQQLTDYTGNISYISFLNVTNIGSDPMTDLQLLKVTVPFELRIWKTAVSTCLLSARHCRLSTVLQPGDSVVANASVKVEFGYSGYFAIVASSRETATADTTVWFSFQKKLPSLKLSTGNLDATISRGKTYNYQINVTNFGLRPATKVTVILPNEPIISILSFGTNTNPTGSNLILDRNDSAILNLEVTPSANEIIGIRSGNIQIKCLETSSNLNYRMVIASDDRLNLTVSVEDEYTYFSADKPLLANATVSLTSKFGGKTVTLITNAYGHVTFYNIREDYYTLYTSADRHKPNSRVIFASAGYGSYVTVFIQRVAVTYSWIVTPVKFEDRYDIKLEADFTTYVPIPVVTLTPNTLDLDILERGLMPVINFAIRNYGLIAAKGFRFKLPAADTHPFLRFRMDRELVGDIPANSTIIVAITVIVNETKREIYYNQESPALRKRRSILNCLEGILASYYYICKGEIYEYLKVQWKQLNHVQSRCAANGFYYLSYAGAYGPLTFNTGISVTLDCNNNCLKAVFSCISATMSGISCFNIGKPLIAGAVKILAKKFAFKPPKSLGELVDFYDTATDCFSYIENVQKCATHTWACLTADSKNKVNPNMTPKDKLIRSYGEQFLSMKEYFNLGVQIYGDYKWLNTEGMSNNWLDEVVQRAILETSPGGFLITESEYAEIVSSPRPKFVTPEMATTLLRRLNNTFYSWDQGYCPLPTNGSVFSRNQNFNNSTDNNIIDCNAFSSSINTLSRGYARAEEAGFTSLPAMFLDTYQRLRKSEDGPQDGVCAKVRIQISQRLVLTRSAFSARLEIENGETEPLANIRVEIIITDSDNQNASNKRFSIGKPDLSGISDVNGTGYLPVQTKGSAQWLIAPYTTAAPTADKKYSIGGTLYYTVNEEKITVPLFPSTVTVEPDPRLHISYFLEKYVYADDPLTTDAVEPVVPFSLGILITNEGYGTANSFQISSAQPEIIDNEKGLLVKFALIGTDLSRNSISPSLTLNFGDILPKTTKAARWIMTTTLSGTFSNYSATFQNTNPLGDPQLSVLDSLKVHDMLHVVKVDYPVDDGIFDFLTIDPDSLEVLPHRIYTSQNGTQPLNVSIGNITKLTNSNRYRAQVTAVCMSCDGWAYFRTEYQQSPLTVRKVRRSDGRIVLPGFNVWIGKIKKKTYLHIVDYMHTTDSTFTYSIELSQSYSVPPKFSPDVYNVSIVEESDPKAVFTVSVADREDNRTLRFSLRDETGPQPFAIGAKYGVLTSKLRLDRETQDQYSVVVLVEDDSSPPLTGTAIVLVNVEDINDNAPVFGDIPSDISVEQGTPAGYRLCSITVSDRDCGPNGTVQLHLSDSSGMFELDTGNGTLVTRRPLEATGVYELALTAIDEGTPSKNTSTSIKIRVLKRDLHTPVFSCNYYAFDINETKLLGTVVGQLNASDADNPDEKLTFEILTGPRTGDCLQPFQIDNAGKITNILELKSHPCSLYALTVRVTDSGFPPYGPLSATVNVTINIMRINYNAPEFHQYEYTVHMAENSPSGTTLLRLKAFDIDFGLNGTIFVNYTLTQIYPVLTPSIVDFQLDVQSGEAILKTSRPLDRERQERHSLQLVAEDGGQPSLRSKPVTVNVIVDDVNDNPPLFLTATENVTISRTTPVNAVVFNVRSTDADSSAQLRYLENSYNQFFQVQPTSGDVILVRGLQEAKNVSTFVLTFYATDGLFNSTTSFTLSIHISDENKYPPRFEAHEYNISISESEPVDTLLLRLSATDPDSAVLYYAITSGNIDSRFKVNVITGTLVLVGQLNRESLRFYNLTVEVLDSPNTGDGTPALSDKTTVYITVLGANEYAPVFTNGPEIQVHLTEGRIMSRFLQLKATDGDGDNVMYSIMNSTNIRDLFEVDRDSGWLSQIYPLYGRTGHRIMLQIAATDTAIPSRQSVIDVIILIDEPVLTFEKTSVNLTLTKSYLMQSTTIYQAKATKGTAYENSTIVYSIDAESRKLFTINSDTGVIDVLANQYPIGIFTLIVSADGPASGTARMTLKVSIIRRLTPAPRKYTPGP